MLNLNRIITLLAILITFSQMTIASEPEQIQAGKKIASAGNNKGATPCISCHGIDGSGQAQAGFPRLAGLNPRYMEKQLADFTSNKRKNLLMTPIASTLSADEITAVSYYFSTMPMPATNKFTDVSGKLSSSGNRQLEAGKKLAENGDWPNNIPACFSCHGKAANGIGQHFPALAAQHASYIEAQLKAWQSGQRNNDPNQLMKSVAMRLSETQIQAVSAYLASLTAADVTPSKSTSNAH